MRTWPIVLIGLLVLVGRVQAAESLKVLLSESDPSSPYCVKMIQLALAHMDQKYEIQTVDATMTQSRLVEATNSGALDIMWAGASSDVEEQVEPVYIPLYKGLLGHRILIIRKGDQPKFDAVKSIEDLRKVLLGQGTTWSDTKILEANGFQVVKTMKYTGLFYMLDGGRFDAFPRAVFEPFAEIEKRPMLDLAIEKKLMLVYKMDMLLFVAKKNKALARQLETGLKKAIEDGSFDKLFLTAPNVQEAIQKGNLKERIIIKMENPFNPTGMPINDASLWFDPSRM